MLRDREDAARRLARRLADYRHRRPLILAVPRGAVPMGRLLADLLDGELDVVLVHKLGAPGNPELAIGSVTEDGEVEVSPLAPELGASPAYLESEASLQLARLLARREQLTAVHPPVDPRDRLVIVVDDGVATGSTLIAALRSVRRQSPRELVAAVAVAPRQTLARLEREADRVVCLESPSSFHAVSQLFVYFPQVSEEQMIASLTAQRPAVGALPS